MKILKILLYCTGALVALVVVLGLFARHDYHVERSLEIDAPFDVVKNQVQYLKNFAKWSPWGTLDPNMNVTFSGEDGAVGAVYAWDGNEDVGAGRQTIKAITQDRVDLEIQFLKPWESKTQSFFKLEPVGSKIKVSWGFDLHIGFPWNGLAMFTDVNAGVGKDFERGLNNLKKVCEDIAHPKYRGYEIVEAPSDVQYFVGIRRLIKQSDLDAFYTEVFPKLFAAFEKNKLTASGPTCSLTFVWDDSTHMADIAAALPIASRVEKIDTFSVFTIPASSSLKIDYFGKYDTIGSAHLAMEDYMRLKELDMIPPCIEQYITDPATEPDTSKWHTKLTYFVKPKAVSIADPAVLKKKK